MVRVSSQTNLDEAVILGGKQGEFFFNTINLSGPELSAAKEQTGLQDERVLGIFTTYGKMTPIECWKIYCDNYGFCVLTSIRRSITVLTRHDKLVKLAEMKAEQYGKKNYLWTIKTN